MEMVLCSVPHGLPSMPISHVKRDHTIARPLPVSTAPLILFTLPKLAGCSKAQGSIQIELELCCRGYRPSVYFRSRR